MIVLDASAVLVYLFREVGHEAVAEIIEDSCLSTVNLSEVLGRFVRDGHDAGVVLEQFHATRIEIVEFDDDQAVLAANLVTKTQPLGLSLGDRACLALGLARGLPVLTADRAWRDVGVGVEMRVLR